MKPLYLKFTTEKDAVKALTQNGFTVGEDGHFYHSDCLIDVIGIIRGESIYDSNGDFVGSYSDKEGWHVNLLVPKTFTYSTAAHVVNVKTPVRIWSGYEVSSND